MNTTSHFAKATERSLDNANLINTVALARWNETNKNARAVSTALAHEHSIWKPLKRLLNSTRSFHRAKATVLMRGFAYMMPFFLASQLYGQTKPLYENNFEKNEVGKVPEEFLVLDGQFTVKEENGNKLFELPGAPLDSFGVLFGPTETSDVLVSARILGTAKGRRAPTFGIGANGVGGYRLQVSPGKKMLELYKGDEVVKTIAYEWKSGAWTELRLQIRKVKDSEFKAEGKVWTKGNDEPKDWTISHEDTAPPPAGRASIWGSPYADTAIQFDDLSVSKIGEK